jgi:predicted phage terminase large subunit-like protein
MAVRERVWDWYTTDIYTRLEPDGAIILIMTRWHEDDLAGRIKSSESGKDWEIIELPAEAEENDPLGREVGEPLCPARFDKEALEDRKLVLGRDFYALYQQKPRPREGQMFKRHWFDVVEAVPFDVYKRIRYWDKAGTEDAGAYTSGVRVSYRKGLLYIEDVVRGRWEAAERNRVILQTAMKDHAELGPTDVWLEQEPGSSGKEVIQTLIKTLLGFSAHAEKVTGDKVLRAEPFAAQAEAGNVKLVQGPWVNAYLDEIASFPGGRYKDQVDASSGAVNKLANAILESFVMSYK